MYDYEDSAKRIDYDLSSNYSYNLKGNVGFRIEDIAYVLAEVMGENDGPDYHWLVAMNDHTYAYVSGGCDYTGWDCQSSGAVEIFPTLKSAIDAIPERAEYDDRLIRKSIKQQLTGDLAFGEAINA